MFRNFYCHACLLISLGVSRPSSLFQDEFDTFKLTCNVFVSVMSASLIACLHLHPVFLRAFSEVKGHKRCAGRSSKLMLLLRLATPIQICDYHYSFFIPHFSYLSSAPCDLCISILESACKISHDSIVYGRVAKKEPSSRICKLAPTAQHTKPTRSPT